MVDTTQRGEMDSGSNGMDGSPLIVICHDECLFRRICVVPRGVSGLSTVRLVTSCIVGLYSWFAVVGLRW